MICYQASDIKKNYEEFLLIEEASNFMNPIREIKEDEKPNIYSSLNVKSSIINDDVILRKNSGLKLDNKQSIQADFLKEKKINLRHSRSKLFFINFKL